MTKAEQFCKLNGIEPTYKFLIGLPSEEIYPTFTDAKSILEVMLKRKELLAFASSLREDVDVSGSRLSVFYVFNPDKLLDEAIKWCEKETSSPKELLKSFIEHRDCSPLAVFRSTIGTSKGEDKIKIDNITTKAITKVQRIIKQYDGIFDPTKEFDSGLMAEHIVKHLKRYYIFYTREATK